MEIALQFEVLRKDIAEVLRSKTLMGEFRGKEVWKRLREDLTKLPEYSLLLIDTTSALFLDYDFCKHALAPLFSDEELERQRLFVIFQLPASDRNAFFHGVLKHLAKPLKEYSHSQETFVSHGLVCKILASPEGPLEFVGSLVEDEEVVLKAVNDLKRARVDLLARTVHRAHEDVVDSVRSLVEKGFVIDFDGTHHEYYSFNNYLSQEGASND